MTDTNLFKSKMALCGYTQSSLAEALQISLQSMSYKLNNKREFTASEMATIYYLFRLTPQEVVDIFFKI